MAGSHKDPVREYLEREADALASRAARGDAVSPEQVDALDRLAKLLHIRDSARPRPRAWWPPCVLAGALVIASVLLFVRVTGTDIEMDLLVSELRFTVARDQAVTGPLTVSTLGASGLSELRLPGSSRAEAASLQAGADGAAVRIALDLAARRPGTATLAPLVLPSGSAVGLRAGGNPHEYVLSVRSPGLEMRVDLDGANTIAVAGAPARHLELAFPKAIGLKAGGEDVDLAMEFQASRQAPIETPLPVNGLSLSRIDQFTGAGRTLVRRVSTVQSGTLFLESLNGEKRVLRPGEELQFEQSAGEIRALRLEEGQIALRYRGRVRGMTTGSGEGRRSLMPTCLDWMRARHGLSLLWGAALYLFGLFAGAMRWWGARV